MYSNIREHIRFICARRQMEMKEVDGEHKDKGERVVWDKIDFF